jgi:hypothetical protein
MSVSINFYVNRNSEVPKIDARISRGNVPRDSIECKYAALAARYFLDIRSNFVIDDQPHIDDVTAKIVISSESDNASEFDGEHEDFDEHIDYDNYADDVGEIDTSMMVGFSLEVSDIDVIGGMLTPAPVMATAVYDLLLQARSGVTL